MGNPTYTPLAEAWHNFGFVVSQPNGHRHVDQITLLAGANYLPGQVLGQITAGNTAAAAAMGTNTGNGTVGAVTLNSVATQIGVYTLTYTSASAFTVTAPSGATANGTNGVAFNSLGIGFTITAGGTPFVAGDGFTFTTADAPGNPTAVAAAKAGGNTGNGTSSAVTVTGYAPKLGTYTVTMIEPATNLGNFSVEDPTGLTIGHGTVGTAFTGGGLTFTIADGATDFVSGDQFRITVAAGSGKFKAWDPGATDGSQIAAGIHGLTKYALNGDKPSAAVVRTCEVNASELVWPTNVSASQIALGSAQLKALGIILR